MNNNRRSSVRKGFTLIEIMVVLIIIGIMAAVVAPNLLGNVDKAKVTRAKSDIMAFSQALKMYMLDNNFYPSTEQGLSALIVKPATDPLPVSWQPGGYLDLKEIPKDPWGGTYIYRSPGDDGEDFVIICMGKDGKEGGTDYAADIKSSDLR